MDTVTLTINNTEYVVKFGFGAFKQLAKIWGVAKFSELGTFFNKLTFKEGEEPTIEQLELVGDIVHAGILNTNNNTSQLDVDAMMSELLFNNSEKLKEVMELFAQSMPKTQGKSKRVKKAS